LIDGSEDTKSSRDRLYFMLHYCMDLFTLEAREFLITDEKTGEKLANFKKLGIKRRIKSLAACSFSTAISFFRFHAVQDINALICIPASPCR